MLLDIHLINRLPRHHGQHILHAHSVRHRRSTGALQPHMYETNLFICRPDLGGSLFSSWGSGLVPVPFDLTLICVCLCSFAAGDSFSVPEVLPARSQRRRFHLRR